MPKTTKLTIATRCSPLAMWQSEWVKQQLQIRDPELIIELLPMKSQGDILLETSLSKIGGKGLFIKELEQAMLDGHADLAVHSMKDMPAQLPEPFMLAAICQRGAVEDAFISYQYPSFDQLPKGATLGTSSLRRQSQLLHLRPDLSIKPVRGNLQTRLNKLNTQDFDALILASTGLERLGLTNTITERFAIDQCLPAIGQGAIGVECLNTNTPVIELLASINHPLTELAVLAERAMNQTLGGSCQSPIAGHANWHLNQHLCLSGIVASADGQTILRATHQQHIPRIAPINQMTYQHITALGHQVAEDLLYQGAQPLLDALNHD